MFNRFKHQIRSKRTIFSELCTANGLQLDFEQNKSELKVLDDIFRVREYADYFPFYQDVTIIDVGAHYGYFSIFAAQNSGPNSRILAFEPDSSNFRQLNKNLANNKLTQVEAIELAIGGKSGEVALFSGKDSNHSIIEDYTLAGSARPKHSVSVKTLEAVMKEHELQHVDFLKMDCEGAEYQIFETLPSHVFDRISTISMEFHDLKDKRYTANALILKLKANKFKIVKYAYGVTTMNLNYGRLVATKEM